MHDITYQPRWTTSGAWSLGRDPLGMQATSVRMYRQLVPGLTNVTNRLRYYSFYCWVVHRWAVIRHADDLQEWRLFIRRAEALFAIACEAYAPNTGGLAGSEWARLQLATPMDETFDLRPHTNRPGEANQYLKAKGGNFGQFYVRSMQETEFLAPTEGVPVVADKGREMANAFEDAVGEAVASKLTNAIKNGVLESSSLPLLGEAVHPSNLKDDTLEMGMLRNFLWGADATEGSQARRTSAWLLLDLAQNGVSFRDTVAIRSALYKGRTPTDLPYDPGGLHIQRWRAYQANELCHIALEALLNGMTYVLNEHDAAMEPDELASKVLGTAISSAAQEQAWCEWASTRSNESHNEETLSVIIIEGLRKFNDRSGDQDFLSCAVLLLRLLWQKWHTDDPLKNEIAKHSLRANCSLAGVLGTLNENEANSVGEALSAVLRRHVIAEHLAIAGIKLSASGKFTYRFMLEDGNISNGRIAEYGYTNPRLTNLANFLADAKLINTNGILTETGKRLINETQPA